MNRRSFLQAFAATATGLLLPEPRRVYSFASALRVPGWSEWTYMDGAFVSTMLPMLVDGQTLEMYQYWHIWADEQAGNGIYRVAAAGDGDRPTVLRRQW